MNTVTGSLTARSHRPVAILFVLSVVAFLAASVLTVIAVADTDAPEPCCAGPVAASGARPSPTSAPPATREPGLTQCVVGSWRSVEEVLMVKFYSDVGELPMTTSGRHYEFRADGTGVERNQNIQIVGSHRGERIRLVVNGWREFTWTASSTVITYKAITRANMTWSFYDNRGLLETQRGKVEPQHNEVNNFTCSGRQLVESNGDGYRSVWARTGDYGYYG